VERIPHEFSVLIDFDSRLQPMQGLCAAVQDFKDCYAALAFPLLATGKSMLARLQDLEYAYLQKKRVDTWQRTGTYPFVPGAGGIWRTSILKEVFKKHSGIFYGDDHEASEIAKSLGYKISFTDKVYLYTQVPESMRDFLRQRTGWEIGRMRLREQRRIPNPVLEVLKLTLNSKFVSSQSNRLLLPFYPALYLPNVIAVLRAKLFYNCRKTQSVLK
jgi:cellulose synthase/poly-beta-1,6-N-acetylglucosamine synthase-like glycosyltransferase